MFRAMRVPQTVSRLLLGILAAAIPAHVAGPMRAATAAEPIARAINVPLPAESTVSPDALGFDEIVFVKRKPYSSDHYYTDINSGTNPDRFVADNGIYVYNLRTRSERAVVKAASMPGGKGFIGKISLSPDAGKVVFDFRQDPGSGFRIWEVNVDGTACADLFPAARRVGESRSMARVGTPTTSTPATYRTARSSSPRPAASTRSSAVGPRNWWRPVFIAWTPTAAISNSSATAQSANSVPVVLDDGRVMYHRWEYIDKGSRVAKSVWSMNPDGSGSQELYGLAHDDTTVCMYPQPLPGSSHRFVCVGTCHYPQGGCLGPILLVDFGMGVHIRGPDPDEAGYVQGDPRYPVVNITPYVFIPRRSYSGWRFLTSDGKYADDPQGRKGRLYTIPIRSADREFLVSCKLSPSDHYADVANAYALCLIDTEGRLRVIHADAKLSCWHPLPLRARPVSPHVPSIRDAKMPPPTRPSASLPNVYQGMEGVKRGEVKWLRINESLPRYWSTGRRWNPSVDSANWKAALWPRVQWGVVPVEEDGSAQFVVPAKRSIFFQALDKDFREIQRERTYVNYAPGEVRSCTGCHGQFHHAASRRTSAMPLASARPPSTPSRNRAI